MALFNLQKRTKTKLKLIVIATVITGIAVLTIYVLYFTGRSSSRLLGKDFAQVIQVEDMTRFISLSFDKRGSSTVKDVTYQATDGYIYTREYRDISPMEGVIRWVPHGEPDSVIQSRGISRWTGAVINLELPEDCADVLGVDITWAGKDERTKNLTYRTRDGKIFAREYLEGLMDRNFGGWMQIKRKL